MLRLVKKDFFLQKKLIYFAFGYSIFIYFAFQNEVFANFIYSMGGIAVAYIFVMSALALEEKNNTDIILNSLPLKREKIVVSKYLTVIFSIILSLIILGVIGALFKIVGFPRVARFLNVSDISFVFAGVGILSSCYIPAFLKFGSKYMRFLNMAAFFLLFFLPSFFVNFLKEKSSSPEALLEWLQLNSSFIHLLVVLITVIIIFFSIFVSVRIYNNKEF